MGTITILEETTKKPITLIGERAGTCWRADISDPEKNYKRGMDCIVSEHGRTLEFPDVHMIIDGYSARVMREYTRHVGGLTPWLQASTRYIDYKKFDYIIPPSVLSDNTARSEYERAMKNIAQSLKKLEEYNIPREDIANLLPLGMTTRTVEKRNLRNIVDMMHTRKCTRAYWEFRKLLCDMGDSLSAYSEEWKWIVDHLFIPKCEYLGRCPEKHSCGRYQR